MKEKILKLRLEGKSYNEISKILNVGKSLISYYCGEGQKEKSLERQRINRKKESAIIRTKIQNFCQSKIRSFKKRDNNTVNMYYGKTNSRFSYNKAYKKIFNTKCCYLSGRKINIYDVLNFSLDHIIPVSKGGKNTLKNMGISCKEANMAKNDLTIDDFIQLCIDVCQHNGYKVEKIN